jgi:hypothetical protein
MKALIVSASLALVFLTGCAATHHEGSATPVYTTKFDTENTSQYALMGPRVQASVTFAGTQTRVLDDGRLQVITNVRNRENRRLEVQISCVFKDEQNFSTGDETPWHTLILTENVQEAVNFTSMNNRAKNFTIRVREAH